MFGDDRNSIISDLKQKVALMEKPEAPQSSYWNRLTDLGSRMSDDQKTWVFTQDEVIQTQNDMITKFNQFIFEKYKGEFASYPEFSPFTDKYIAAVASAAEDYGKNAASIKEENEKLKAEIAELKKAKEGELL